MKVNITGNNVEVTEALNTYLHEKLQKIEKHFDQIIHMNIILSIEKLEQKAEATIHLNKADLFASSKHNNMYAAIDDLVRKLDKQVIKFKETHFHH